MQDPTITYFVTSAHRKWLVHSENHCYGPFGSYSEALSHAIEEAEAAETFGFASAVLACRASGGAYEVRWRSGFGQYGIPLRLV